MTATTRTAPVAAPAAAIGSRRRTRGVAVAATALATGAIYLAGRAAGVDFRLTDPGRTAAHQLILPEIAVFTLVFALLGWACLAVLERLTRRAAAVWTALAAAVLLLSFVPIGLEQATVATKILLAVIHLTVAAVIVPVFRFTRR